MDWLNYHHLLYFWTVAKAGTIARASEQLQIAQPTISGQIHALEESFGTKLLARSGRNLVLTDIGRVVFGYAEDIFSLGREMQDVVRGRPAGTPMKLTIGNADTVSKLIAYELLKPALRLPDPVHLAVLEDKPERLLEQLAAQKLDVVIANGPVPPGFRNRAFHHLLGESGTSFFSSAQKAPAYKKRFPLSLDGAPALLPLHGSALSDQIEQWFEQQGIRPVVAAESQDSGLLTLFGADGHVVYTAPTVMEAEIKRLYGAVVIGRVPSVVEHFYAISVERKLRHPAVVAISDSAKLVFAAGTPRAGAAKV